MEQKRIKECIGEVERDLVPMDYTTKEGKVVPCFWITKEDWDTFKEVMLTEED